MKEETGLCLRCVVTTRYNLAAAEILRLSKGGIKD
jgi:hypothetical protein